jgi:hypothetical protein
MSNGAWRSSSMLVIRIARGVLRSIAVSHQCRGQDAERARIGWHRQGAAVIHHPSSSDRGASAQGVFYFVTVLIVRVKLECRVNAR